VPQPSWERYILVVEDDPQLRELYRYTLRSAGYAVIGVEDGVDALRMIEQGKPRAVVLDLALPRLNGLEVFKDLRGNRATRAIPVIVVTRTDTSNLDRSEFACVLEKPISAGELVDAVHNCLNSWRVNDADR
jgi:DNA-binding response OmpR family regulator